MRHERAKHSAGVALVELIVALVVLAVGVVGMERGLVVAIRTRRDARELTYATMLAQSKLAELRAAVDQRILDWRLAHPQSSAAEENQRIPRITIKDGGTAGGLPGITFTWESEAETVQEQLTLEGVVRNRTLSALKFLCRCKVRVRWKRDNATTEREVVLYGFVPLGVAVERV